MNNLCFGIDLGKKSIAVCQANPSIRARQWPVATITYEDPHWWKLLQDNIPTGSVVVMEPTGYHYAAPVIQALGAAPDIYQVSNSMTGKIREAHISSTKSDALDARALAYIAQEVQQGRGVRTVRPFEAQAEEQAFILRLHLTDYLRLRKEVTRCLNRLDALGHGLWPQLVIHKSTWLNCLRYEAVDPHAIKTLARNILTANFMDARRSRHILTLADKLPDLEGHPVIKETALKMLHLHDRFQAEADQARHIIAALVEKEPFTAITQRWQTVPTISPTDIAALHVATRGQADRLTRNEFKAACGVSPLYSLSGDQIEGKQNIAGYRPAKTALHLLTMRLIKEYNRPNPIATYFDSHHHLKRKDSAARRKLASMLWGIAHHPDGSWPQ